MLKQQKFLSHSLEAANHRSRSGRVQCFLMKPLFLAFGQRPSHRILTWPFLLVHREMELWCFFLLLLLSHFSSVRLCATPQMAALLSLGFSRQEQWSRLPFPSPVHESENWKWSRSVVSNSSRPHGLQPTRLLHPWDFPGKSTGVGCHYLLQCFFLEGHKFYQIIAPHYDLI